MKEKDMKNLLLPVTFFVIHGNKTISEVASIIRSFDETTKLI